MESPAAVGLFSSSSSSSSSSASTFSFSFSFLWAALIAFIVAWAINRRFKNRNNHNNKVHYPPHPLPCHFLWGNAPEFPDIRKGHHMDPKFLEWAKELGRPVYSLKVPILGTMIVIADPDLMHHVMVTKNFDKSWTYKEMEPIVGKQALVMMRNGPEWRSHRKTFSPGFAPSFLKDMVSVMCDKLTRYLDCLDHDALQTKQPTNMMDRAQTFTSDVIVQIGFGEDWGGGVGSKPHPARGWLTEIQDLSSVLGNDPMIKLFGFKEKRRLKEVEAKLNKVMDDIVERRLEQIKELNRTNTSDTARKDTSQNICSLAIDLMMQSDGSLTTEDRSAVVDQLKMFYFGGHDTIATTIAWAGWLLSQEQHAPIVQKLRQELQTAGIFTKQEPKQKKYYKYPTYNDLQQCEFLDAVVKEVLRLYPPGATARYTSDMNETWNGYTLGGAVLYCNSYILHRLPQYWDRPDDFFPERFVGVAPQSYAHKYIPFSKGSRDCLGKYFAMLEVKLAVAALVQRYDMACLNPNETMGYRHTAYPYNGAKVQLNLRK